MTKKRLPIEGLIKLKYNECNPSNFSYYVHSSSLYICITRCSHMYRSFHIKSEFLNQYVKYVLL